MLDQGTHKCGIPVHYRTIASGFSKTYKLPCGRTEDAICSKETFKSGMLLRRVVNEHNVLRYIPGMQRYCSNEAPKKNGEIFKTPVV
mgnify:CR=1 FL=1